MMDRRSSRNEQMRRIWPLTGATVTVREITPGAGEHVGEDTVISATVEYAIDEYAPDDEYRLEPVFESRQDGTTFNAIGGLSRSSTERGRRAIPDRCQATKALRERRRVGRGGEDARRG